MESYLAAVVQLSSGKDSRANLDRAHELIKRAAGRGARLVATPENTNYLGPHADKVRLAEPMDGPTVEGFANLARSLGIVLVLGSFNERGPDSRRCYNTSVVFGPTGEILGSYRKIHLFDVDLSDRVRFVESDTVMPGETEVVVPTSVGKLGLSICYDLRFPELYGRLRARGAEVLLVPAAFTRPTGQDHWLPLLKARAIETQCYVLAPAQCGRHDDRGLRESHGHSVILNAWGDVLANVPKEPGIAMAEVDLGAMAHLRRSMPVFDHRRL